MTRAPHRKLACKCIAAALVIGSTSLQRNWAATARLVQNSWQCKGGGVWKITAATARWKQNSGPQGGRALPFGAFEVRRRSALVSLVLAAHHWGSRALGALGGGPALSRCLPWWPSATSQSHVVSSCQQRGEVDRHARHFLQLPVSCQSLTAFQTMF